jgi:hypothetical protein
MRTLLKLAVIGLAVRWVINKLNRDRTEEGATVSPPPA